MEKIVSLCKRRGFIFQGSEIYGGLQNSWDYGPLGVELKNNIKNEWWKIFVQSRADMVGLDAALIMNPQVWAASGHISEFNDQLVECKKCHERFDLEKVEDKSKCAACGEKNTFTEAKQFNTMFKTFLGPTEDTASQVYLRPETAQAIFVDFKNILETSRKKIPFGVGQIGKAFRNEITPGNFIFRTREFEQMEVEYFVQEKDWEKYFDMWLGELKKWLDHCGIKKGLYFEEVSEKDRAHYSKKTIDIEYDFPFGQKELYGLAYRTDFDLKNHKQSYTDPETQENYIPHVIEPSLGVDRTLLAILLESYTEEPVRTPKGEDETRIVLKFPKWLSPIKVAILPLSKKGELENISKPIFENLSKSFVCEYDVTQSIGKRYRRQDEIGTPYCITVDFESEKDQSVTVRDRDTMKQDRVKISELEGYLKEKFNA